MVAHLLEIYILSAQPFLKYSVCSAIAAAASHLLLWEETQGGAASARPEPPRGSQRVGWAHSAGPDSEIFGPSATEKTRLTRLAKAHRFRSGPPQILISKFRGAAANFEVDFDCQNASVLPQDRAYRRRTPTHDIPPLNWTRSPPQTRLTRGRTAVLAQAIALRSPATDRAHLPALAPITSSAGGRRMTQLFDGEHERPAFLLEDPSQAPRSGA